MFYLCIVDDVVCSLFGCKDWIECTPECFCEEALLFNCIHTFYIFGRCKGTKLYIHSCMFCVKLYIQFARCMLKFVYTKTAIQEKDPHGCNVQIYSLILSRAGIKNAAGVRTYFIRSGDACALLSGCRPFPVVSSGVAGYPPAPQRYE